MNSTTIYDALARSASLSQFESAFLTATGLMVELAPVDDPNWLFQHRQRENPFCSLMAENTAACAACRKIHAELRRRVSSDLQPQFMSCFAGLVEFAVPVLVGGQHVATFQGGQVLLEKPSRMRWSRLTRQLRIWEMQRAQRRVEKAFLQTRVISEKQLQACLQLLTTFARSIPGQVDRGLLETGTRDRIYIAGAKDFVRAHARETLRLGDVAAHVNISAPYFCKLFKKSTAPAFRSRRICWPAAICRFRSWPGGRVSGLFPSSITFTGGPSYWIQKASPSPAPSILRASTSRTVSLPSFHG